MKIYTRNITRYEVTCPFCGTIMVYDDLDMRPQLLFDPDDKFRCENCFKWFQDSEVEKVEAPNRREVQYVRHQRA